MNNEIRLGDEVEDLVTGFVGIAVARTKFMNGCTQYTVAYRIKKGDSDYPKELGVSIDEQSLRIVKKNKVPCSENRIKEEKTNGGFPTRAKAMRGF
jgi:hypothetical protein